MYVCMYVCMCVCVCVWCVCTYVGGGDKISGLLCTLVYVNVAYKKVRWHI